MKKVSIIFFNMLLVLSLIFSFPVNVFAAETPQLTASIGRNSGILLKWTGPENTKYTIYRQRDDGYYDGLATRESRYGLFYLDATGLEVGKKYTYKVSYFDNNTRIDSNVVSITAKQTPAAENEFTNQDEATQYLKEQLVNRNKNFTIIYNASTFPSGLMQSMYEEARKDLESSSSASADEGDYLRFTIRPGTIQFKSGIDGKVGKLTSYTFNYQLDYYTTSQQEKEVNNKVKEILNGFAKNNITSSSNTYDKCKAVYDYLTTHLHYNNEKNPDTGEIMITAYDSLVREEAQCYGQTLGAYRLLKELGVVNRRVNGKLVVNGQSINHSWNIVLIDGKWYNFDATASAAYYEDTGEITYKNFLKTYDYFVNNNYSLNDDYAINSSFGTSHPYGDIVYEHEPNAPSELKLENLNDGSVKATFSKVDGVDGYALYRSTSKTGPFTLVGENTTNTITDKNITLGVEYHYKVKSYKNINGYKIYSSTYSPRRIITPDSIDNPYFEPISIKAASESYNSVRISWNKAKGVTYYQVYRATSQNGKYALLGTYDQNTTSSISRSLATGTTYYYKVRGYRWVNGERVFSSFSNIVSASPKLEAPKLKSVTANTYNSLKINWEKSNGTTYYQVYRATSQNGKYALLGTYDQNTTSSISRSLATGTTYYYKVRGYRWVNGERVFSSFSNIVSASPKLEAPKLKSVTANTYNSLKINWEKSNGTTYYQVYRATSQNGKYALLGTYDQNTTSSISRSLATGTTYYYKVRGYRWVNGERVFSSFSNIVSASPKLEAPKLKSVTANTYNSLKINWEKINGTTYYQVYRSTSQNGKYALLGTYDQNTTSSISRSLATGTTYYYKVRGYRWVNGERVFSSFSNIVSASPKLEAPKLKSVTANTYNSLKINWEKSNGTTYYQVYRSTSQNGKYALLGTYDQNTTSSISRSLVPGETYYYKVRGYRWVNGERVFSSFSNILSKKV